ncbi:MAG: alpha/beta fold hydrolase, partial [Thermoanaerobaculia bacterium]
GSWTRLPEATRESFRSVGWKLFQEVMSLTADQTRRSAYATIAAPMLVMGGAESPITERRVVEILGATIPGATVKWFRGVGHMAPISHAPLVNAAIAEHLRVR